MGHSKTQWMNNNNKSSTSPDGQFNISEEIEEPGDSRHSSAGSERKTSSRKKAKSNLWSDWIWSDEHKRHYCYREKTDGETEYHWAPEAQTAQEGETSTPEKADELSLMDVTEPSAAPYDLDTTPTPSNPFSGAFATKDDLYNPPPLDPYYGNIDISIEPHHRKASITPYIKTSQFSSGKVDYVVDGTVNNVPTSATPDNGSDTCILSSSFAAKLGLTPIPNTEKTITLANRRRVMSPGMVWVRWIFAKESRSHELPCLIIPGCFSDFILGSQLLKATETFTRRFKSRVKKIFQPRRLRLGLIGEGKQYLSGYLAPWLTAALADTGSDIMAISFEYAKNRSMLIDYGPECQVPIELPDGSVVLTLGMVHGIPWAIGDQDDAKMECDFYVIEDLTEDVILSKHYLFSLEVFSRYSGWFLKSDPTDNPAFCGIRLIDDVVWDPEMMEREFLTDFISPDAFSHEKVAQELARRDMVRDRIALLPASEQDKAIKEEEGRKIRWNEAKKKHRNDWAKHGGRAGAA